MEEKANRSEEEWRKILTPEQYRVLRKKSTEPPFSGKYVHTKENGMYVCAACGSELFSSEAKFDSGTGWPSFYEPVSQGKITLAPDTSYGMARTEALCGKCGGHLGHVFDDGPQPTGKRYCINSVCLELEKKEKS